MACGSLTGSGYSSLYRVENDCYHAADMGISQIIDVICKTAPEMPGPVMRLVGDCNLTKKSVFGAILYRVMDYPLSYSTRAGS